MKAVDLLNYLYSLDQGWMDFKTTVDTFKSGDPETEISGIAVAWQSYTATIKKALQLGCNVFITHEPTFYNHYDLPDDGFYTSLPGYREKKKFIEESGLVILRCHDLWDQMPGIGITDTWAKVLGLEKIIHRSAYYQVYEIPEITSGDFARRVAAAVQPLGQAGVEFIGPLDTPVQRVGIGTGAISNLFGYASTYEFDLAVCADDATVQWQDGEYATDQQIPMILVNHAVSEEMGIQSLARHLQAQFPHIPIHHIPQGCTYRLITPPG